MASNDQILKVLADMQEIIAGLRVTTASVPDIKDRTDELIRAIRGHNGTPGLTARVHIQEQSLAHHVEDYNEFRVLCDKHQTQTSAMIEDLRSSMAVGFDEIKDIIAAGYEKAEAERAEIAKEQRAEERDVRKDKRKFRLDIAMAVILLALDIVLRFIGVF